MNYRILLLAALLSAPAIASDAGPFSQGRMALGLGLGSSSAGHFIIGGGLGYYVYDGLRADLDLAYWFGEEPTVWEVSPGARYTMWFIPVVHPYGGVFYRRLFVDSFDDIDSVGWRAGITIRRTGLLVSAGIRYDTIISDCSGECDTYNPELAIGITF